ncbi:MAG: T9SS type A sorting domain-containing protein, partial [Cyclobacteriaceae bacterium]|nr:T9SS type A sorting domain-containing protein [Cyclobacteriaceae bacterium]
INGILARQTNSAALYDFPTGKTSYRRVGITPTTAVGSTYRVEAFESAYTNLDTTGTGLNNISKLEYWDIQRTAGTDPAQVRLYWNTQAASGITLASDLSVVHFTGAAWVNMGNGANSGDIDPGFVESATATTTFSPFTFGSLTAGPNPLPVELVFFSGKLKNNVVTLEWATAQEINNDYFEIQRSIDGLSFEAIGNVAGHGNASDRNDYSFTDENPFSGLSYYRLKQVDFDGKNELLSVISIVNKSDKAFDVKASPNPASGNQIQLRIDGLPSNAILEVHLYDLSGKSYVYQTFVTKNPGNQVLQIERMDDMAPGIYFASVQYAGNIRQVKIILE